MYAGWLLESSYLTVIIEHLSGFIVCLTSLEASSPACAICKQFHRNVSQPHGEHYMCTSMLHEAQAVVVQLIKFVTFPSMSIRVELQISKHLINNNYYDGPNF